MRAESSVLPIRRRPTRLAAFAGVALTTLLVAAAAAAQTEAPPPSAADYAKALDAINALAAEVKDLKGQVTELRQELATGNDPPQASSGTTSVPNNSSATMASDAAIHYRGLMIEPTGFVEAANQYRSKALGSDLFSPFGAIPFDNVRPGHVSEDKFSARGSRFGLLALGEVSPTTHLAAYGEIDFLGAAQSANFTESNSFQPRLRHLYATLDLDKGGWHFLAGQTWTLAVLNSKGLTPRNEVIPPSIDAQFIPGFVWARQPQVRITKDFGKRYWLALSIENPQTTFAGAVPPGVVTQIANSTGLFDGVVGGSAPAAAGGGTAVIPTAATSSLNPYPDVIAKAAAELSAMDRPVHLEVFGLGRAFTDRIASQNETVFGGGVGFGLVTQIMPGFLDLQLSGLSGKGIGRYGTSGLPDVTFNPTGRIEPVPETTWLAGATMHVTPRLDVYLFGGEELESRRAYSSTYGLGIPSTDLNGCLVEGGACSASTRYVMQIATGFWRKLYEGSYGHLQVGLEYSYTERHAFSGLDNLAPATSENIVFTALRFYPFQ